MVNICLPIEQLVYVACVHVVMGTHYIVHTGVHDVHALLPPDTSLIVHVALSYWHSHS